ncbi:MAG: sensor histidine kinase [Candidatus Hermodarchaeota archaeon]
MSKNNFIALTNILKSRVFQHTLFWLSSFVVIVNLISNNQVQQIDLLYTLIFHVSLVSIVYLNVSVLFPLFVREKRFIRYLIFAAILCVLFSFLNSLIFNRVINLLFPDYYFISIYSIIDLFKFHAIYIVVTLLLKFATEWFSQEDARLKLSKIEREKVEIELKALRAQVNPHFLFNSLNVLYSLALRNARETPETIIKLSDILRYVIYNSNKDKVSIKSEVELVNNYLSLQEHRVDKTSIINFTTDIQEDIDIAPMLFLPLVENGFKHGVKGDVSDTYVYIKMKTTNKRVDFEIENNKGTSENPDQNSDSGIGLANIEKRLNLLYPEKHSLIIKDDGHRFKVSLKINL